MDTSVNIFDQATRQKIRFEFKGTISVEDLWGLKSQELDQLYRQLSAEKKSEEVGLIQPRETKEDKELTLKLVIVRHIFEVKAAEADAEKRAAANKVRKDQLLEILAKKQASELDGMTKAEIEQMIAEIG